MVPSLAQAADLVPHPSSRLGVETGGRLVEEQDRRSVDDAQPDVEPALHPARVGGDRPVRGRLEIERRQDLGRASHRARLVHAVETALDDELAATGLGRVGRAALRDVADPLAYRPGLAAQVGAGDHRLTRGRREQRGQHPEGRGLAGPIRAEEAEDLAGADRQVDTTDRLDLRLAGTEGPGQIVRLDHRLAGRRRGHVDLLSLCCRGRRHLRRSASSGNICTVQIITQSRRCCQPWTEIRSIRSSARCAV